jgi:hypothetical protein
VLGLIAALLSMLQEILLDLLLGAGAGTAKPSINGLLLQILTLRLPGTITEVLSPGCEKCPSKLSAPCLTQSLLHPGQHTTLLFLDVMVDRFDQLIEGRFKFGRLRVHRCHLFEHLLSLSILSLAVGDLVGLSCLVLGNRVNLDLFGSRVGDQEGTQDREVQTPSCRLMLQQVEQPLDLAVIILDQLDNICSRHGPPLCARSPTS